MKKPIKYEEVPLEMAVVKDFLPPPKDLVLKDLTVKVTIHLSKPSVAFFKRQAGQKHVPYQTMIRRVLDLYASHYASKTH